MRAEGKTPDVRIGSANFLTVNSKKFPSARSVI
jgi:hypothetical protein